MAAGFVYNLNPQKEQEEKYDVKSGVRRIGAYKLDTTGLDAGSVLPSMIPICADLKMKTAKVVNNVRVVEKYTTGSSNLSIKIAKGSLAKKGDFFGDGTNGAEVAAVVVGADYDTLTIKAAFGANIEVGEVLFAIESASGTTPLLVANSALYNSVKVGTDDLVTLLMRAFEIETEKLAIPFSAKDKANMRHFEFND